MQLKLLSFNQLLRQRVLTLHWLHHHVWPDVSRPAIRAPRSRPCSDTLERSTPCQTWSKGGQQEAADVCLSCLHMMVFGSMSAVWPLASTHCGSLENALVGVRHWLHQIALAVLAAGRTRAERAIQRPRRPVTERAAPFAGAGRLQCRRTQEYCQRQACRHAQARTCLICNC